MEVNHGPESGELEEKYQQQPRIIKIRIRIITIRSKSSLGPELSESG